MSALLRRHFDLLLLATIGVLLVVFPQVDLRVSGWFYDPQTGFWLKDQPLVQFIYNLVPWVTRTVVIGLILFLLAAWTVYRRRDYFAQRRRTALYLLLVMAIGPGILVNTVFKDHWGRARPSQIIEFGGTKTFTPAAIPADQCPKNCSFVSGHASVGFYFLALAFVLPRRRALWLALGTTLGLGVGLVRIMQGGHFFSDVIFCGIIVYLTARALHTIMFPAPTSRPA